MKKVLFAASTKLHIQMFHMPYIEWLMEQGISVHVLTGMDEAELDKRIHVIELPFEKKITSLSNWQMVGKIKEILEREQYDVISTHTTLASFFVRCAIKRAKLDSCKVITTVHGYLFDKKDSFIKRLLFLQAEKMVADVTDCLIVMNDEDEQIANRYHLFKNEIIKISGMGLNVEQFCTISEEEKKITRDYLGISNDKKVLVYAAEFSKRKNHAMLLRVMKRLPREVELLLLGNGIDFEKMKKMAFRLHLLERIHFIGKVPHTYPYLLCADVAVSTSRYEGKPFHLMEALSAGLPIVVSDVKGNRELARSAKNSALFPYNDESEMEKKILWALSLEKENAPGDVREEIDEYTIAKTTEKIFAIYQKVLELN